MNELAILGFATAAVSILVKAIGLPDQIRKNYKRKSVEGLSAAFFALSFFAYLLWTIYGYAKGDWVVFYGQGFGMITMGVIAVQLWIYRGEKA